MNNPLVSIIIPTYARPDNLCRAIDSVLDQTYSPIEILVVDDNGEGTPFQMETEKLLIPYIASNKITYLKHETNKNGSAARNTGSRASRGEIIGYLDDDDVFLPNKIEEQVKRLMVAHFENPKVAGVYCNIEMQGYKTAPYCLKSDQEGNLTESLLMGEIRFNSSSILVYRFAYDTINGWDERFKRQQDWEFCVRFFSRYEMALAKAGEPLIIKYSTPNYNSANPDKIAKNMEFFIQEMRPYIINLKRNKDILHKKYFQIACLFLSNRQLKTASHYLILSNSYKRIKLYELNKIVKSTIKGYVHKK